MACDTLRETSGLQSPARIENASNKGFRPQYGGHRWGTNRMTLEELLDRQAIIDVVQRYASGVDSRDWALFRSCFCEEIEVDLSSWNGQPASRMRAEHWVAGVKAGLTGFDATQHISSNHGVTLDRHRAACTSYVRATHSLEGECCVLGGYYDNELVRTEDGWRIEQCKLTVTWTEGPQEIFERAAQRYAESNG